MRRAPARRARCGRIAGAGIARSGRPWVVHARICARTSRPSTSETSVAAQESAPRWVMHQGTIAAKPSRKRRLQNERRSCIICGSGPLLAIHPTRVAIGIQLDVHPIFRSGAQYHSPFSGQCLRAQFSAITRIGPSRTDRNYEHDAITLLHGRLDQFHHQSGSTSTTVANACTAFFQVASTQGVDQRNHDP